jgi:hypothetical protein
MPSLRARGFSGDRREERAVPGVESDGTEVEIGPGEAYVIEPGHDAWVVGDGRFVGFEFESRSAEEYAKG